VENSGVLVPLGETLILRNHLETNFNFFLDNFRTFSEISEFYYLDSLDNFSVNFRFR
jgi:hypothetical protein